MNTAGAAVLPGTGRTARSSQPGKSLFAKGHWYYSRAGRADCGAPRCPRRSEGMPPPYSSVTTKTEGESSLTLSW